MNLTEIVKTIKNKGLTAYEIAKETSLSEVGIQKIINGKSQNPRKSTIEILERYLHNLDGKSEELKVNGAREIFPTKAGSVYEELGNGKFVISVPLVPVRAQATYISEFHDIEYINELERVDFIVDRVGKGKYQAFEVMNDSMNDGSINSIPDGALVLGRELGKQHWKSKFRTNQFPYWIIVHKDTILCKEIIDHDTEKGTITCHSLNGSPEYQDFTLKLNDVHQLFNIVKKQF